MNVRTFLLLGFAAPLAASAGCGDDTETSGSTSSTTSSSSTTGTGGTDSTSTGTGGGGCGLTLPATYESPAYEKAAAAELTVRAQFKAFTDPMKAADLDLTVQPTAAQLTALFDAGSPSLRAITTPYYAPKVETSIGVFVGAAGKTWAPVDPPSGPGGQYGKYLFTATGTDIRQSIEKGLFGAALYNHAFALMKGTITEATIDSLVAIYGAHPSFPQDDKAMTHPDTLVAQYAKRRNKPGADGPYQTIKKSLITAKAAAFAGASCDGERDAALATFRQEWEKVIFSTVIFYLNDASLKLSTEPATTDTVSGGLHGYGEVVSFVHGYRGVPQEGKKITDAQIDELLAAINAPHDKPATSYKLATDAATEIPKLQKAITTIATIYGFSAQEVDGFKLSY